MDKKTNEADTLELLREMAAAQRRSVLLGRITTAVIILMAAALIVSLVLLVPKLMSTLDHARSTLGDTQQIIQRISTSLDELDRVGENLEKLTGEGSENLEKLLDTLGTIDLDALTSSIQSFNSVLERLASFSLFG